MKRFFILLSLIAVLLLVGCGKNEEITTNNGSNNNEPIVNTVQKVSKLDDAKDWVYDAEYEKNVTADSYTTLFEETYYAKDIVVPYINVDSTDAKEINEDIKITFDALIESYNDGIEDSLTYIDTCEYKYGLHDDILSGVFKYSIGATDVPVEEFYTFNIDLKTGKKLSYKDVYTAVGFDEKTIDVMVNSSISKEMTSSLGDVLEEYEVYEHIILSQGNYFTSLKEDEVKYFIDDNNKLVVIVALSKPAGRGLFDTPITIENNEEAINIEFLENVFGVYGEWNTDYICVFPGSDDEHIDVSYFLYRAAYIYLRNLEITKNEHGILEASKVLDKNELDRYNGGEDIKVDFVINNGTAKLSFNANVLGIGKEDENTQILEMKDETKVLPVVQGYKALGLVRESNGKYFNDDVFEIVKDTENYIVFRVKCYLYSNDGNEGSYSVEMFMYYNYDKNTNKMVTLEELLGDSQDEVNEYIKKAIEEKKQAYINGTDEIWGDTTKGEEWPYQEFKGLSTIDSFDHYFLIDEDTKTVEIRCLPYPSEAQKALGDLCIDVPFSLLNIVD